MSTNPLYKLTATADKTTAKMLKALKRAQDAVKLEILKATQEGRIATDAQERERLFKRIHAEYAKYGVDMAAAMAGLAEASAKTATDHTASSTGVDVHFSKPRLNALWSYLSPPNSRNLSAVFTDQMAEGAIKKLRGAFIDTYRQAQVEGWTANETSKQMRDSWDSVAHDSNTYRFVDKSGKPWENARYLQMLHRTTAQRVERDYTIDRMAEAGVTLYRISGASEECATCKAWAGQIIQMSRPKKGGRNFPTYAQALAAGMFHPNCIHFIEPMDEDWGDDAEEIERQEAQKLPTDMSADEMQTRRDEIEKTRYIENDGLSAQDAGRAVTRDKLLDAIRTGVMDRELSQSVADGLSPADYDRLAASMPSFQKVKIGEETGWRKGSQGGVVRIPRDATAGDVIAIIAPKAPPTPPSAATPKPVKPVVTPAKPVEPVKPVVVPVAPVKPVVVPVMPTQAKNKDAERFMTELGVKVSTSPLAEEKTNPNYNKNFECRVNCQRCVPTWEMRKRGYDVEALPKPRIKREDQTSNLAVRPLDKVFTDGQKLSYRDKSDIDSAMASWGDGARAQIVCVWKNNGGGHTFVAEQVNGKTRYFDPQTNEDMTAQFKDISIKSSSAKRNNLFMRIDNLDTTERIKECCKASNPTG